MKSRKIIVLLIGASAIVGAACLFIARTFRCDDIAERPMQSPDGRSAATSTLKACPVGFLPSTNCSVSVALSVKSPASSSTIETSAFEASDAAEVPTLTWVNGHELVLRLNDIGEVQISKHQVGDVRIRYTVPKWIWDRLGTIESDRLHSERESQDLYKDGKLSKDDLRASSEVDYAVAKDRANFRQWVIANATVEDAPR